ncbi:VOC family protein [Bacillus infantis]|uniref:VOC family protein n=1 Tax=Bacillus infantis TaxID=324767 RepID=UPI001CD81152|nr:VOC family protein [Bacillus infantis]MCA1035092.1 VOC family protein [Bacillus infantis]
MTFRWDGGFIMVSWDGFEEGVEWYTKHFGWSCLDKIISPVGKKAFLKMPRLGVVTLKSFEGNFEHFQKDSGTEGHVRLCFEILDIDRSLSYFKNEGIEVTPIAELPGGQKSFDIIAYENARITAVYNSDEADQFPDARITGFGPVNARIGVRNLDEAISWYEEHLGLRLAKRFGSEFAHMQVEDAYDWIQHKQIFHDSVWLETAAGTAFEKGSPSARNYFDLRPDEFYQTYELLSEKGLSPSEIAGNPTAGWGGFHFYDPDGNMINVWSYPL